MNLPEPGTQIKCQNPDNLPEGAGPLEKGKDYTVISARVNNYGQRIVFIRTQNCAFDVFFMFLLLHPFISIHVVLIIYRPIL